ncbi:MAG: 2-C-methyl-D-erythritol 4-phosphate cytidylyltransferase [Verrucomicrobiota bacterium]
MKDCSAILLAAGSSRRLGFDKILTPLAGRPAFRHAYDVLVTCDEIAQIIIVTREDLVEKFHQHLGGQDPGIPVQVVAGGKERQDSVYAGLKVADTSNRMALIHDAARPLITAELVTQVLQVARETGAAICGRPCSDTLKRTEDQQTICETPDRSQYWQVETPQVFERESILKAYRQVIENSWVITDDASAFERAGGTVSLVESAEVNLKITKQSDWEVLQLWLAQERGTKLRKLLHQISNEFTPLTGYLPFLKKYREVPEKFEDYHSQMLDGTRQGVETLKEAQSEARTLFPDQNDG